MDSIRRTVARELEQGPDGRAARLPFGGFASGVWATFARVARPLVVPAGRSIVTVGGATLGGSGKTPVAIACARVLAERGVHTVFVGHGTRARPSGARPVRASGFDSDACSTAGDEALEAAHALARLAVPVVVGPTRQGAVDVAADLGDVIVVDGPLQLAPRPADLAILVVDAEAPWGSGACPPRGDLRAPPDRLLAHADLVVRVVDPAAPEGPGTRFPNSFKTARYRTGHLADVPVFDAETVSRGVLVGGRRLAFSDLDGRRIGLVTGLARPDRVRRFLERRGVRIASPIEVHDHGFVRMGGREAARLAARLRAETCDLWLTTPKCGAGLGPWLERMDVPFGILDHEVRLADPLRIHLESIVTPTRPAAGGRS